MDSLELEANNYNYYYYNILGILLLKFVIP